MAGPVMLPAVEAVTVKMPAPITTDTPKTVRSHQLRSFRNRESGSSVSAIDCSTDLTRNLSVIPPLNPVRSGECTQCVQHQSGATAPSSRGDARFGVVAGDIRCHRRHAVSAGLYRQLEDISALSRIAAATGE